MIFKKKITLETFVNAHYVPFIDEMINSELDLLEKDISENSNIKIEKNNLHFELFILFSHLSGRGLSRISGFSMDVGVKFTILLDEIMQKKYGHLKLNEKWLDKERGFTLGDMSNYYKNKSAAYREAELSYHNSAIDEKELSKQICKKFFSIENNDINEQLAKVMGEIHKGSFIILYKELNNYSKKYKLT